MTRGSFVTPCGAGAKRDAFEPLSPPKLNVVYINIQ